MTVETKNLKSVSNKEQGMKTYLLIVISATLFILNARHVHSQNFVDNGTFEALDSCPYDLDQVRFCKGWIPIRNSPDFFHCGFNNGSNFHYPNTGAGYMGVLGGLLADTAVYYYGEAIKAKLASPLIAGKRYLVKFSVGLDVFTPPHIQNDFGLYFFNANNPLSFGYYSKGCLTEDPQIRINANSLLQGDYVDFSFCFIPDETYDSVLVTPFCNSNTLSGPLYVVYFLFDDFEITEFQATNFMASPTIICDSGYVNFNVTNWTQPTYLNWQFENGNPLSSNDLYPQPVFYNQPGSYDVTLIMDDVCNDTITKTDYIKVAGRLTDVLPDEIVEKCFEERLSLNTINGSEGLWSTGIVGSSITVEEGGTYYFTQMNECDTLIDSIVVRNKICPCGFFYPNSFTPNNDGTNDSYKIYGDGQLINFSVFNRFGQQLYYTEHSGFAWDGKYNNELIMQGVYVFSSTYIDCFNNRKVKHGVLNVVY